MMALSEIDGYVEGIVKLSRVSGIDTDEVIDILTDRSLDPRDFRILTQEQADEIRASLE